MADKNEEYTQLSPNPQKDLWNDPENIAIAQKARREAGEKRKEVIQGFGSGKYSMSDVLEIAQSSEYVIVGRISVASLLGTRPRWSKDTARQALANYGVPVDINLSRCNLNKAYKRIVIALAETTTTAQWQVRSQAETGFPWRGNIMHVLKKLKQDGVTLFPEADRAVDFCYEKKDDQFVPRDWWGNIDDNATRENYSAEEEHIDSILGFDPEEKEEVQQEDDDDDLSDLGLGLEDDADDDDEEETDEETLRAQILQTLYGDDDDE